MSYRMFQAQRQPRPRNWESANTPRLPHYLRDWNRLHMQQSLGNMFVWQEAVVVSFTSNRPFYRYGGHIEFIRFKEYYGMPPGGTRSVFTLAENFTVYFSGKRQSLLHPNTARRSFFPLQSFSRKTRKYWASISDSAHALWASHNTR